jgi:K+ transporter
MRPGAIGKKSFFDKNKNKINLLMEVLTRNYNNCPPPQKKTRIYLIIRLQVQKKSLTRLFQHLEKKTYHESVTILSPHNNKTPKFPSYKNQKNKATNEKAFQKYTKS